MDQGKAKGTKRGSADDTEPSRIKKAKIDNPYAAHLDNDMDPFADFVPRETTAKAAEAVEDGDTNAFTGKAHSMKYFSILQTRRDLPVQKQRFAHSPSPSRVFACAVADNVSD